MPSKVSILNESHLRQSVYISIDCGIFSRRFNETPLSSLIMSLFLNDERYVRNNKKKN